MQAKYYFDVNGMQHIKLEHMLVDKKDENLCPANKDPNTNVVSVRQVYKEMCPVCLAAFRKSDHPEAIAYRKMWRIQHP